MKQKFTIEKHKYLENKKSKNETMFNFKISCLMKKQLISLMMVLAMVILAGTSAMAQNTDENATIMFAGAERTYSVTDYSLEGNVYDWQIFATTSGAGTSGDPYVVGAAAPAAHYSVTGGAVNTATVTIQWSDQAGGGYCIQMTESNEASRGSCSTVRQFFITVIDFDLHIYASLADGTIIPHDDALLNTCGANSNYNPWFNDETDLTDNTLEGDGSVGSPYSTRYITASIAASSGIDFGTTAFRWQFPYTIIGGDDTYDVSIVPVSHTATEVVVGYTDYQNGTVTVELDGSSNTITSITLEIQYQPKWANDESDINLAMNVAQSTCVLDGGDTDSDFDDGVENAGNYSADPEEASFNPNQSSNQIIRVSPATSTISIAD